MVLCNLECLFAQCPETFAREREEGCHAKPFVLPHLTFHGPLAHLTGHTEEGVLTNGPSGSG